MKRFIVTAFSLCFVFMFVSCRQGEHVDAHHHDAEPMTRYNNDLELYAELPPLIVGEQATISVFLTALDNHKPFVGENVVLELSVNGKTQTVEPNHSHTQGVYTFAVTPAAAGCGSLLVQIPMGDTTYRMGSNHQHVFASHDEYHSGGHGHHHGHSHGHSHGHDHGHNHGSAESSNVVSFTKQQSWMVDFATEICTPEHFGGVIKTAGQVLSSQCNESDVVAKNSGIIVFSNPNLVEGATVKNGQQLFTIESNGMADNNMNVRFQEAVANFNAAKSDYERKQQLAESQIVSAAELDRAKSAYDAAKAVYDNLKGNFSQKGAVLRAPLSGYVKSLQVRNGAYVEAGQPILTVSQNRDLFIRAEVQSRYYNQLDNIVSANFVSPNGGNVVHMEAGALVSYGKGTHLDSPLIPVTFRFQNTADLISGTFVTLYIKTSSDAEVLTVANDGIVEEMGNHFVFVQITPVQFEKRLVTLGPTDGMRTEVVSGLKKGERVVSKGAFMLKLAQASGALDPHAGHVH